MQIHLIIYCMLYHFLLQQIKVLTLKIGQMSVKGNDAFNWCGGPHLPNLTWNVAVFITFRTFSSLFYCCSTPLVPKTVFWLLY